ncbi:type IV toxin-antitoxin system AbiEi family antitoxin domain-containing protein [Sphingomonas paeninsulae]|uniref:type IV toxin-antitoxin system AbiEi family antitoxin domain-containing protein n=1 Tax=Sphingomonas paeninsulae TaxID=2319844 RepID=UPI001EF0D48B|nr:type IV toxin-antitoxin system AbiEi family antitoxin domain-containing protein [Sphingomonas paeninsulae]
MAVLSAQRFGSTSFYVGGITALELLGQGHFARLGDDQTIHLYDPDSTIPSWLPKLPTDAAISLHKRALFSTPSLGIDWHRLDLGTDRLGAVVPSPDASEPWDHFLKVAGAERASIEMLENVPQGPTFEHADMIFENLTTLRPKLLTNLLESCTSVRAKRLFLFFADRHGHGWSKHIDRSDIDLGRGKRQLVAGGRLDARYQITVPASLTARAGETAQ